MRRIQIMSATVVLALAALFILAIPSTLEAQTDTAISLVDLEGSSIQLSDLVTGKPTLLVFWATWCGPCRAEIPRISEAFHRFSDSGLVVLAINPGIRDSMSAIRSYVQHFNLPYPVYFDAEQASRSAYSLIGTPTVILFDAEGREIQRGDRVDIKAIETLMAD